MGSKSKQSAARLGDIDTGHPPSPPTPIVTASSNVFINGRPAARKGDMLVPHHPGIRTITEGARTVKINGKPAARVTDGINCGGKVIIGSGNVYIGDKPEAPRNAKTYMEFSAIIDAGFEPENQNLTPYQQAEIEAAIAVKYNPKKGAAPVWHEHYMSNEPEPGSVLSSVQKSGLQKAQAEKAKQAVENIADAKDIAKQINQKELDKLGSSMIAASETLAKDEYASDEIKSIAASMLSLAGGNDKLKNAGSKKSQQNNNKLDESIKQKQVNPQSFDEARGILKESRRTIAKNGKAEDKYTQEELLRLAKQGDISDKYIVRVIESKHLGDNRDGYLGGKRDSGEIRYWSTTLDQIANRDTDPRLIVPSLGLDYDENADYTMIIVDKAQAQESEGSYAMLANYENMSNFAKAELAHKLPHKDLIDETLTKETSEMYLEAYQAMESVEKGGVWEKSVQEDYFNDQGFSETDKKIFHNRLALHEAAGTNEDYLGNGLTKNKNDTTGNKPFAAVETYAFDKNPETIKTMLSQDNPMVSIIHLREIPGIAL